MHPYLYLLLFLSFSVSAESKINHLSGLKIAPGWQLVKTNCSTCHSTKIITMQHNSRNDWKNIMLRMQNIHGLRKLTQETKKLTLDYLSKNYPPVKATRRINLPINALPNNPYATSSKKKIKHKVIVLKKKSI